MATPFRSPNTKLAVSLTLVSPDYAIAMRMLDTPALRIVYEASFFNIPSTAQLAS